MPSKYSVYAVAESDPPKWEPGEDLAASAIVAVTFYLVLEVQFEIFRAFKKRKGLYFWSVELGIWGCALDAIGISLKFLARKTKHLWPLETLFILGGWSIYSTAQLLILYSRLHFVCRNHQIQRFIFFMIIATVIVLQIPSWVTVWPAYADIPRISSEWSPRDAIVERFNQLGYTIAEAIISGIYIKSLLKVLKSKSSVRQRRVMLDLIYVNVLVVASDILEMVLVWLNINGLSHPIQTFSYAVKFRLEFVVLNQLMAVAARGLYKEGFAEKRYHHPSTNDEGSLGQAMQQFKGSQPPQWTDSEKHLGQASSRKANSVTAIHIPKPQVAHQKTGSTGSAGVSVLPSPSLQRDRTRSQRLASSSEGYPQHTEDQEHDDTGLPQMPQHDNSSAELRLPLQSPDDHPSGDDTSRHSWSKALEGLRPGGARRQPNHGSGRQNEKAKARVSKVVPKEELHKYYDEEEEVALHMWERNGEFILEVPWLGSNESAKV